LQLIEGDKKDDEAGRTATRFRDDPFHQIPPYMRLFGYSNDL
jgi:hypothetical protein